ncbi:TraR/DksA family transcriptional regulator [Rhodovulum adriaticum]|uniref:TraR/DksA family transcriptional regulator n=1 Tax=Rhodovulum adriaticum TaxID=35804 RepID=A0A4V6NQJ9_RHOAD|nr:TraR/DksA C4-type zinc finger protein [Rhodovulum adriaticum]MBK1636911.1 molecular chaperone DnaK [Rhodovulum adriaticum]TCP25466.1 TraR/DksA family transcriptional regulator [Rhodovulum adriaticum]
MPEAQIAGFRARLAAMLTDLQAQSAHSAEDRRAVALDQQSVGRLSRMDAMQRQTMAKATHARRTASESRIRAALARIDAGAFGYCTECGEKTAAKRLDLDPTVPTCIACAR